MHIEFCIIIFVIFFVLFAELINTAIEKSIDVYTQEYNENAKIAKDIAAGAVTLTSIAAVLIGAIIFLPQILNIL